MAVDFVNDFLNHYHDMIMIGRGTIWHVIISVSGLLLGPDFFKDLKTLNYLKISNFKSRTCFFRVFHCVSTLECACAICTIGLFGGT